MKTQRNTVTSQRSTAARGRSPGPGHNPQSCGAIDSRTAASRSRTLTWQRSTLHATRLFGASSRHSAVLFRRHITHSPHRDLRTGHLSEAQFLRLNSERCHHCTTVTYGVFHACFTPPARDMFLDYCPHTSVSHACTRTPHPRRAPNSRHTGTAPCCRNRRRTRAAPHPPAATHTSPTRTTRGGRARKEEWGHGR